MKKYRLNKKKFSNFCFNTVFVIFISAFTLWFVNKICEAIIA